MRGHLFCEATTFLQKGWPYKIGNTVVKNCHVEVDLKLEDYIKWLCIHGVYNIISDANIVDAVQNMLKTTVDEAVKDQKRSQFVAFRK